MDQYRVHICIVKKYRKVNPTAGDGSGLENRRVQ